MAKKPFKIPGDTIIIPMFIGCLINTFFPQVFQIGGFTTALIKGAAPLVGVFLFFIGGTISLKNTPKAIWRGSVITFTKIIVAVVFGLSVARFMNNNFFGLSAAAIIAAMSVANTALYAGVMEAFGNEVDAGAIGIATLNSGPMVTMIALSSAGLASISVWSLIGTILPLVLGITLAHFFPYMKRTLSNGVTGVIIVVGFALGANMSFNQIVQGGVPGILLGLMTTLVVGSVTIILDKVTGGSGVAGAGISSTAAAAIATPAALSAVDSSFQAIQATVTAQITASVIVTAILAPILTAFIYKQNIKAGRNPKKVL